MRSIWCLAVIVLISKAMGQEPAADPLADRPRLQQAVTLPQAVEIALQETPVLRGAAAELEAAAAGVEMARAMRRPMLSTTAYLSGGSLGMVLGTPDPVSPTNLAVTPAGRFADLNLMVMLPLSTGGRLSALVRQAQAMRAATAAQVEAMRLEVALEARLLYREVLLARAFVEVARSYIEAREERVRIDQAAADVGRIPEFWVLRSQAELANARQMLVNTRRDEEVALVALKAVMGVHPDSQIGLADALAATPMAADRDALRREALERRPELRAAGQQLQAGAESERAARALYRPQIGLMGMTDLMSARRMDRNGGYLVGVALGLPILDGGRRASLVDEARAMQEQARWQQQQQQLTIVREVDTGLRELQAAVENVSTAETALQAAEEDLRVAGVRYQAGRSVLVEYLDALTAAVRARVNHAQALFEQAVAGDRLLRAAGRTD